MRRVLALALLAVTMSACTPEEWIATYFDEVGQTSKAIDVASCESGLNPEAVSPGGGNHGLFQINNVHRASFERVTGQPWSERYNAGYNTMFAHWLWEQQGWGPWACG